MKLNILLVGGGKMSYAIAKGIIKKNLFDANTVGVIDPSLAKRNLFKTEFNCHVFEKKPDDLESKVVLWAVKPKLYESVVSEYKNNDSLYISIMAGVTIQKIESFLNGFKIARIMPNIACTLGHGITLYYVKNISEEHEKLVHKICCALGQVAKVEVEEKIDKVTPLSSSGPALIYYFATAFIDQALKYGFTDKEADFIVRQTFFGASQMLKEFQEKPIPELIKEVATKGGLTEKILQNLDAKLVNKLIVESIETGLENFLKGK